jgi:sugar lactone lactonase YvrE
VRLAWSLLASSTILLAGCSVASIANQKPDPGPVAAVNTPLSGRVHGGPPQAPISGAEVYLFAVHTGAYNHNSDSLLLATTNTHAGTYGNYVLTGSNGNFQIGSGDYACTAGQEVYLYSVGGNPGLANGTNNSAATLMSVVGTCGAGNSFSGLPTTVQMNEVTTVAAAYALAGYATTPTQISGNLSGTAQATTGLANAAKMAGVLASITTGNALAPGLNGSAVQQEIDSLANSLAACVNTTGPTASNCTNLLPYAGNASDTASAALYIAHNPGSNISNIYSASTAYPQFTPHLGAAPNDWTLAITYDGNINGGTDLAFDSTGSVYVTESDSNDVLKFTAFGARSGSPFTNANLNDPYGIAVDGSDNVWVTNWNSDQLVGFTSTGAAAPHSPFTDSSLSNTFTLAIDPDGNFWVTNSTGEAGSITEFSSAGALKYNSNSVSSGYGGLHGPDGIAIQSPDVNDNFDIWVTNPDGVGGTAISRFNKAGQTYTDSGYTTSGMVGPIRCAIDSSGRVWTANYGGSGQSVSGGSISRFNSNGGGGVTYTVGGVNGTYGGPYSIAIDGANHVWVANYGVDTGSGPGGSVTELDSSGNAYSPANGFQPGLPNADSIAIDGSGNVWVVDNGGNTLTELVGAATPVVTPLSTAVKNSKLGTAP